MKWSELKKLTIEERREMRRKVAISTISHITNLKRSQEDPEEKIEEEVKEEDNKEE
jgi:hypothetical protein